VKNTFGNDIFYNLKYIRKMDTGASIIVLVLTGLVVFPFLFNIILKKKKNKLLLNNLLKLAEREKISISHKELWNKNYAIGIDINSKKILYVHRLKDKVKESLVDLKEVKECRIINTDKTIKNQPGNSSNSDRLELVFSYNKTDKPEISLEFYNNSQFKPTIEDVRQIENWLQIFRSNLIGNDELSIKQ
jgi:hypothetical protein